jgi:hypothetical protein
MKVEQLYLALAKAIEEAPSIPPCQTTDPEVWFADYEDVGNQYRVAKKLCGQCPVKNECLEYALESYEPYGIWGGLSPRERVRIRVQAGQARPLGRPSSR